MLTDLNSRGLELRAWSTVMGIEFHRRIVNGEAQGTAKLCEMVDGFFDCLNVRSLTEHKQTIFASKIDKPLLFIYTFVAK